ncbi:MAG: hypothetical protein KME17_13760 [Cyanosarcina radialis HA8281-LM2]|nr:hypothetical protein [Cyanosarcina radialis HA8281-LM2]
MISQSDHRLCAVEPWVASHHRTFSVYHQPPEQSDRESLLNFGYSQDRRPDLVQYRQMLATLDPLVLPLGGATLAGFGTDESHYLPTWRHLGAIIGHKNFLFLADCQASSLANRAMIDREGGIYCFPLAMNQPRPKILSDWIVSPPTTAREIISDDAEATDEPIGCGFEVPLGSLWFDIEQQQWHRCSERWLAVCSYALRNRQLQGLFDRLHKAELALKKLADRPGKEAALFEA